METQPRQSLLKWSLYFFLGFLLFVIFYSVAQTPIFMDGNKWGIIVTLLIECIGLRWLYKWYERRYQKANPQSTRKIMAEGIGKWTGLGLLIGFGYFVILALVMMVAGCYNIVSVQFDGQEFLFWLSAFLVIAVGEEIIFRGIIFRLIDERWGFWWALIISGIIFGFVHQMEEDATVWSSIAIAIEAGLLLGAAYKYSGNLWFPIGIHWAWNFTQGHILGCEVSGKPLGSGIITPEITGSDLITGGAFGPEASIPAVVVGFAISCYLVYKIRK